MPYTFIAPAATDTFERFSKSFYVQNTEDLPSCSVRLGKMLNLKPVGVAGDFSGDKDKGVILRNVSLREASLHYELASQLDTASCTGIVNNSSCVLATYQTNFKSPVVNTLDADTSPTGTKTPNTANRPEYTCVGASESTSGKCRGTTIQCSSDSDCQLHFDANLLVKVQPSRECGSWLSCKTSRAITGGNVTKNICLAVEGCEQLNDKGECVRTTVDVPDKDLTYNAATIDQLKDRSGYSGAGFNWGKVCSNDQLKSCTSDADCGTGGLGKCTLSILQGYITPGYMEQVGQSTPLINSNFELPSLRGDAVGWVGWNNGQNFRVIRDPVTAQSVGVSYPREGKAFLEVNANHDVPPISGLDAANYSRLVSVSGGSTYVLSADMNTLHFSGKSAEIRAYQYDKDGNIITYPCVIAGSNEVCNYYALLDTGSGFDWTVRTDKFTTLSNARYISLQFAWVDKNEGAVGDKNSGAWYVDDIKLQPALQYQKNQFYDENNLPASHVAPDFPALPYENGLETLDYNYASQSCRLYPEQSSLSCQYNDSNGLRHSGKLGYCLVRDPQNSNNCIQWWPVDNIIGEDTEQDRVGYQGPVPLYYCAETVDNFVPVLSNGFPSDFPAIYYDHWGDHNSVGPWTRDVIDEKSTIVIDLATSGNALSGALKGIPTGGIVNKPGPCVKNATTIDGIEGCEIALAAQVDGNNDNETECESVYVSNSPGDVPVEGVSSVDFKVGDITHAEYLYDAKPFGQRRPYFFDLSAVPPGNYRYLKIFDGSDTDANGKVYKCQASRPILWVRPNFACTAVLQTVASDGSNKAYANRVSQGSSAKIQFPSPAPGVAGNHVEYGWEQDSPPFGAAVPPPPADDPSSWDTSTDPGQQALFTLPLDTNVTQQISRAGAPYSCRQPLATVPAFNSNMSSGTTTFNWPFGNQQPMCSTLYGALNTNLTQAKDLVSQLFAESYGAWQWINGAYGQTNPIAIQSPKDHCTNNSRATSSVSPCAVAPSVTKITLAPDTSVKPIRQVGSVMLSFTTVADPGQEPIVRYSVDWGDGSHTVQTGLKMASHPSMQNPVSLVHSYSYDNVVKCSAETGPNRCNKDGLIKIVNGNYSVTPRVQVLDNWGWCNAVYDQAAADSVAAAGDPLYGQNGFYGSCDFNNAAAWQLSAGSVILQSQ
ncbi:MAG: hypothetical protein WC817_04840 [Patescibacteria group bacterium]|jgi:hypothetical protein